MCKIFMCIYIIFFLDSNIVNATDSIIETQIQALDLSLFIKEGQNYTSEVFPDIQIEELLSSALSRND